MWCQRRLYKKDKSLLQVVVPRTSPNFANYGLEILANGRAGPVNLLVVLERGLAW